MYSRVFALLHKHRIAISIQSVGRWAKLFCSGFGKTAGSQFFIPYICDADSNAAGDVSYIRCAKQKYPCSINDGAQNIADIYFWHRPILYVLIHLNGYGVLCGLFGESIGKVLWVLMGVFIAALLMWRLFCHPTREIFGEKK